MTFFAVERKETHILRILIANPCSTSYKCKRFQVETMYVLSQAAIERIGEEIGNYWYQFGSEDKIIHELEIPDYFSAVNLTLETLKNRFFLTEISAVGFKTVLSKGVTGCVELTENVVRAMEEYQTLSPVHTKVYLTAISIFKQLNLHIPLVGLFETAFHTQVPPEAYLYGIPYKFYQKYGIRKYGFHGASFQCISNRTKELYGQNNKCFRVISCHLGGSSSVCAIKNGVSVDTSMGMSPQCGLLNATRVGDLDPFALLYLMEQENLTIEETRNLLISKSGVLGIDGESGDLRDVIERMNAGNQRAALAFKTFAYSVRRYIGESIVALNGVDVIVFTAGSGQNSPELREEILKNLDHLGIVLDKKMNLENPEEDLISAKYSGVKIAIIPTNEELIVAKEVEKFLLK